MSKDILAMFAAKQTDAPARGQRDAVSLFKASVKMQIKKVQEEKKSPGSSKTPALNWFKPYDGGYRLQLGKTPIKLQGATHWQADNLDEVVALLEGAEKLADTNADFQKAIRDSKKVKPKASPSK